MTSVVPLRKSGMPAIPAKFRELLDWYGQDNWRQIGRESSLIPRAELPAVVAACRTALVPVSAPKEAAGAVALLLAPYRAVEFQNPSMAAKLYADMAAQYPSEVLDTAIREIHATLKFPPSIAEFRIALDVARSPFLRRLYTAEAMEREHNSREAEAAKLEREQQQHREFVAGIEAKMKEDFGDAAPSSGDYELAVAMIRRSGTRNHFDHWQRELLEGKPWTAPLTRKLALVGRAAALDTAKKVDIRQACVIAALAFKDEAAARAMVTDFEDGKIARGSHRPDDAANYRLFFEIPEYAIEDACNAAAYAARDDFTCAVSELRLLSATSEEIEAFVHALLEDDPTAVERRDQLAAVNRARSPAPATDLLEA